MKHACRRFLHHAALAAVAAISVALSGDAAWPQTGRPIRIVVPAPAGGSVDLLARLAAEQIGQTHGSKMIVENRGGAGGVIGTEAVSRAAPDGNTLLITDIRHIEAFARFLGRSPDTATGDDIRRFQLAAGANEEEKKTPPERGSKSGEETLHQLGTAASCGGCKKVTLAGKGYLERSH
jgi:hypothetical protein